MSCRVSIASCVVTVPSFRVVLGLMNLKYGGIISDSEAVSSMRLSSEFQGIINVPFSLCLVLQPLAANALQLCTSA